MRTTGGNAKRTKNGRRIVKRSNNASVNGRLPMIQMMKMVMDVPEVEIVLAVITVIGNEVVNIVEGGDEVEAIVEVAGAGVMMVMTL